PADPISVHANSTELPEPAYRDWSLGTSGRSRQDDTVPQKAGGRSCCHDFDRGPRSVATRHAIGQTDHAAVRRASDGVAGSVALRVDRSSCPRHSVCNECLWISRCDYAIWTVRQMKISEVFHRFSQLASSWMGAPWSFALAVLVIAAWAVTGP